MAKIFPLVWKNSVQRISISTNLNLEKLRNKSRFSSMHSENLGFIIIVLHHEIFIIFNHMFQKCFM